MTVVAVVTVVVMGHCVLAVSAAPELTARPPS